MTNLQVASHAIGDAANEQVLSAIEELSQTYKGDRRWRIEHAQIVDPVDLPRFGKYGTIASMQPVHETSDRLMAEARLGPQRLAGAYAWASMLRNGAKLAFGSDYPVEKPDPWAGWAAAFTRQGPDGQPFGVGIVLVGEIIVGLWVAAGVDERHVAAAPDSVAGMGQSFIIKLLNLNRLTTRQGTHGGDV